MNAYTAWVKEFGRLLEAGRKLPLGDMSPKAQHRLNADAAKVLIFSPHPDDECIIGGGRLAVDAPGRHASRQCRRDSGQQ